MRRFLALVLVGFVTQGHATLQLRGASMIYDDSTDLTWIRTTSLAAGTIFDDGGSNTDGRLTFASAQAWVSQLALINSDSGHNIGDWRLPAVTDLGATGCDPAYSSAPYVGADCGYVGTSWGASELAILIHGSLGNPTRVVPANSAPFAAIPLGFAWLGLVYQASASDAAQHSILTVEGYFVREPNAPWPPSLAWAFGLSEGFQGPASAFSEGYAWAVRTGDVSAIPEPGTFGMLALGVFAMLALRRAPQKSDG